MIRLATPLLALILLAATPLQAQQFTAVRVEAENYSSKHPDWRLTTATSTPNVSPDPDGSHAGSASGKAYMELLPDTRATHGQPLISGSNFWNTAGQGPKLTYNVNIPEAGRYTVWAKAYSTGTEDNGIHVGANNRNPASGERMQWCGGKNNWTWSSAQRLSSNHCGTPRAIYLDFAFAGANTVTFSAREDGFELDQFILLKTNNNSCQPNNNDQIVCNGSATSVASQMPATTVTPAPGDPAPVTPEPATVTPEPELVTPAPVTPAPVEAAPVTPEPAVAPQPAAPATIAAVPNCTSATSDEDGDGWGWENNQSCEVVTDDSVGASVTTQSPSSGIAVCQSAASDQDGDGWGWEQQRSCRVIDNQSEESATPVCTSASSDSDGDGWGWENSRSCLVQ